MGLGVYGGPSATWQDQLNTITGSFDVKVAIRQFSDEMAKMLKDYSDLSLNPGANKTMQIGNQVVSSDQLSTPAVAMLIQDRLDKIDQGQQALLNIWDKMFKLEERMASM